MARSLEKIQETDAEIFYYRDQSYDERETVTNGDLTVEVVPARDWLVKSQAF